MVLQIMTQHYAIYLVGSLIMMNDWQSLLSWYFAQKCGKLKNDGRMIDNIYGPLNYDTTWC